MPVLNEAGGRNSWACATESLRTHIHTSDERLFLSSFTLLSNSPGELFGFMWSVRVKEEKEAQAMAVHEQLQTLSATVQELKKLGGTMV